MISRRSFINSAAFGFSGLLTAGMGQGAPASHNIGMYSLDAAIRVHKEYEKKTNSPYLDENRDHLIYAFNKIQPSTHLEYIFVISCGFMEHERVHRDIVDEYARRRNGQSPMLPVQPLEENHPWSHIRTYKMLLYFEQIESLRCKIASTMRIKAFFWKNVTFDAFSESIPKEHRDKMSPHEIKAVLDSLNYYVRHAPTYYYCSGLAHRAMDIAIATGYNRA